MKIRLGVVMDPLTTLKKEKDSTLAMLLEAQRRQWQIYFMQPHDLYVQQGKVFASMAELHLDFTQNVWFQLETAQRQPLSELTLILMRKDPPFNMNYIYTTYLLELALQQGTLVANHPRSLRDTNEKLFTHYFPHCCPKTVVSSQKIRLLEFLSEYSDVVFKPLDNMGGTSVFHVQKSDPNIDVILTLLTENETQLIMAQQYIPEITAGDKRILLINGEPIPYALARIPGPNDWRGNLAAGAIGVGIPLSERDRFICDQIGPTLRDKGLVFVGIDVIGDYLTEINVTSPTGIRELDKQCNLNISEMLLNCLEEKLAIGHPK